MKQMYIVVEQIERNANCEIFESMEDALSAMALSIADKLGYPENMSRADYEREPGKINALAKWTSLQFDTEKVDGDLEYDDQRPYLQGRFCPMAWMNHLGQNYDWSILIRAPKEAATKDASFSDGKHTPTELSSCDSFLDQYEIVVEEINEHPDPYLDGSCIAIAKIDAYEIGKEDGIVAADVALTTDNRFVVSYHDTIFRCEQFMPYIGIAKNKLKEACKAIKASSPTPSYFVSGIRNSAVEGWYRDPETKGETMTARIEVQSNSGTLIAEVAGDSMYPGIYLSFRENGDAYEKTVALLEHEDMDDPLTPSRVGLKVWRNEEENEDYQDLFPVFPV